MSLTRGNGRAAGGFRLEGFLPYQLAVLSELASGGFERIYSERFGLSIPEWRLLATVAEAPRVRAKDVVAARHLPKTAVSRAVSRLKRRGCLRVDVNKADRRESFLSLTDKGRALYAELIPLALDYSEQWLQRLTPTERSGFTAAVAKLAEPAL